MNVLKRFRNILGSNSGNLPKGFENPIKAREDAYHKYCLENREIPKWVFDQMVYALGLKELSQK